MASILRRRTCWCVPLRCRCPCPSSLCGRRTGGLQVPAVLRCLPAHLAGQDPEFAKPALDIGAIATAVQASAQEPMEIVRRNSDGPLSNPLVLSLIAFLALSVLGNIVLVLLLLAK